MTDALSTTEPATDPRARVARWIGEIVIGLRLCPFAAAPWRDGQVHIAVSRAGNPEDAVKDTLDEAWGLIENDAIATTLVVFPDTVADFETFLDAAATVEHILDQAGARGLLQVATFHPAFQFEGTAPDDIGNWTNRAPFPIFHLLREQHVSDAIDQFPDTTKIPEDNVKRLEAMGRAAVLSLWGRV